jgi:hypothetical protein
MMSRSAAFPVGLYGALLLALGWLTVPGLFAPLERWLVGSATALPRLASIWLGQPARAAEGGELARVEQLRADLLQRVSRQDLAAGSVALPAGARQVHCGVLAASRRGGGGRLSELLLDHSYEELGAGRALRDWERVVVKGDQLVGFLMEPGKGRAVDDLPSDPARVMLCNHRDAPRVYAELDIAGRPLRFVVRPGAGADPAPLRVDLWDDPYRAAQLDEAGLLVRTRALDFGGENYGVPPGLSLGRARVWGYDDTQTSRVLAIGVYVEPGFEPRALSHVVLWRAEGAPLRPQDSPLRAHARVGASLYDLPGADRGRHLLVCSRALPDDAAVTQRGVLLGVARGLCFGNALMTSFPASRRRWSLLFLPDEEAGRVVELSGVIERAAGDVAWVRWEGPPRDEVLRLGSGFLFTGSNGRFCPSGLWIGRATADPTDRALLQVRVPSGGGARAVEVFVAPEAAR